MGFEPTIDVTTYNGLANRRLQPLGHLSIFFILLTSLLVIRSQALDLLSLLISSLLVQ